MEEIGIDIIRAKLCPPRGTHPWVPRTRLEGAVSRILETPLTVVTASAGFGKTTQLALWYASLRASGVATGWLTLDSEDDDTHQFFTYLLESLSSSCWHAASRVRGLLRNDPLVSYRHVLSVLLGGIAELEAPLVLFLDDVHLLESPAVNDALFRFVRYAPPNLHVVVAGRSEPRIHVSRFQTQRDLYRVDTDDLRFSVEDTQRFFSDVAGRALSPAEASRLWRTTEGWVAGIQLASLARGDLGDQENIEAGLESAAHGIALYLTENVLADMPHPLVDFMLRISVLDRVSGPIAARITGNADAAYLLEHFEQRNLFLSPLDDRREWYCFHALFLDYLRARARREIADELPSLHREASEYFAGIGVWQEAVRHALAAGEDCKAAAWVEHCAMDLVRRSDLRTVIGWLDRLPPRIIDGSLRLRLVQAWSFTLALQPADASRTLRALEQDLTTGQLSHQGNADLRREMLSVRAIVAGLTDDSTTALRLARQVMALRPEPGSWVEQMAHTALTFGLAYERGFDEARTLQARVVGQGAAWTDEPTFAAVYQQCMFGLSALVEGRLLDAASIFSSALRRGEDEVGFETAAATLPAGYLSTILYEWDELAHLEEVLRRRLSTALSVCANGSASRFVISAIRLQALQGRVDQALNTIERACRVASERNWLRMLSACRAQAMRLMLQDGDIVRARRTLDLLLHAMPQRPPIPLGSFSEVRFNLAMSIAGLKIRMHHYEAATAVLFELCRELQTVGSNYLLAQARILLATSLDRSGETTAAVETFKLALQYGQGNGMIRAFLDAREEISELFTRIAGLPDDDPSRGGLDPWYLDNLARRLGVDTDPAMEPGDHEAHEPAGLLRPREREILLLVSNGLSNKSIARQLSVSPETVKWHMKNIFQRLGVTSRIQAVRWAHANMPELAAGERQS
ncbi:MAG: hypothetical protein KDH15_12270 [Rhodocyclaceae bacterium]|nr:hypothetical protein [Rhodocyclaceae bacterium]